MTKLSPIIGLPLNCNQALSHSYNLISRFPEDNSDWKFVNLLNNAKSPDLMDVFNNFEEKKNKVNTFIENFFKSKISLVVSSVAIILLSYLIFFL